MLRRFILMQRCYMNNTEHHNICNIKISAWVSSMTIQFMGAGERIALQYVTILALLPENDERKSEYTCVAIQKNIWVLERRRTKAARIVGMLSIPCPTHN